MNDFEIFVSIYESKMREKMCFYAFLTNHLRFQFAFSADKLLFSILFFHVFVFVSFGFFESECLSVDLEKLKEKKDRSYQGKPLNIATAF